MRIVGHGIDVVEIKEIRDLQTLPGDHFVSRCFTAKELADVGDGTTRNERLAGRYAAKEAVAKAMGAGAGDGFAWSDIEICTSGTGAPFVVLWRGAKELAESLKISDWLISTSHSDNIAVASAIALADNDLSTNGD